MPHGKPGISESRETMLVDKIEGVKVSRSEGFFDERGGWQRVWDRQSLSIKNSDTDVSQVSISSNHKRGTLRGLHSLAVEAKETKTVHCFKGSVFDVIVDMRPMSPTYFDHIAVVLGDETNNQVIIPPGCAHGFQTLEDDSYLAYIMSAKYAPELEIGFHYADPVIAIAWPTTVTRISSKDKSWPHIQK